MPQYLFLVATIVVVLLIVGLISSLFMSYVRKLQRQLLVTENSVDLLKDKLNQVDEELHEVRSGAQALGRKVKELVLQIQGLEDKQRQLAEQDPQNRFYQKGAKLIASGASIEDVMQECELPRAEAELLFSLHQR